jgi:mannose-1-phosphate guanylyltransferase
MRERITPPWALILAGGDGTRLRPLTTQIAGDERPKQFCALLDGETLLERTRRRADLVARFDHQMVVVSGSHVPYWEPLTRELSPGRLVVQPHNRGTAPGIVYPLLHVAELAGNAPVVILPSDHYVSDDRAFMSYVRSAIDVVNARRDLVVLLGIEPGSPETEYGWIGAGEAPLDLDGEPVFPIRRFWEKPDPALAARLYRGGCLWNSFVMIGWSNTFLDLVGAHDPALLSAFAPLRFVIGLPQEARVVDGIYRRLRPAGFSETVLAAETRRLAVMRVKGIDWSDWGHPRRVLVSLARAGMRPPWLDRVRVAEAG